MAMSMINVRGIWRKVEANLWFDEQKSHEAIVKDKIAQEVQWGRGKMAFCVSLVEFLELIVEN